MVTVREFLREHPVDILRLIVLSSCYRNPLAYGAEIVADQGRKLARLRSALDPATGSEAMSDAARQLEVVTEATRSQFIQMMDDDFNASGALAALFELVRAINTARDNGVGGVSFEAAQHTLRELAGVLGLTLEQQQHSHDIAPFVDLLIELRTELRKVKQYTLADTVRNRLGDLGIVLEDSPQGTRWKTK